MKKLKKILTILCAIPFAAMAQIDKPLIKMDTSAVQIIYINSAVTTHIICPEPVDYVDISTKEITGDIPVKNIVRIKPNDNVRPGENGFITIVGEKFFVQYKLVYLMDQTKCPPKINVSLKETQPLFDYENMLSESELHDYAGKFLKQRSKFHVIRTEKDLMEAKVTSISTFGDYFFIKVELENESNIKYDVDQIRFSIDDKKITKATNYQSVEVDPVYILNNQMQFKHKYTNVFVFKKFTIPEIKVFNIIFSEKQISGRQIIVNVDYSDILNADAL